MRRLAAITLICLCGCTSPFDSRTPEPPLGEGGTFVQPVSPQIPLLNLKAAYEERLAINFSRCLDSSYFFRYDFLADAVDPRDSGWDWTEELRLTEKLINALQAGDSQMPALTLEPLTGQNDLIFDSVAVLYRSYVLRLITTRTDQTADTALYEGTATFTIADNAQGLWNIVRWEDRHRDGLTLSWADFKNGYR